MNNPWLPWLLYFMVGFAGICCIGVATYWIFHWGSEPVRVVLSVTSLLVWNAVLIVVLTSGASKLVFCLSCLGVFAVLSLVQAWVEKVIEPGKLSFRQHLVSAFLMHLCLINGLWVIRASGLSSKTPSWEQGVRMGVLAGFVLTLISISALRWILLASKLHPGVDRHFQSQEDTGSQER